MEHEKYLSLAIGEARDGMRCGDGGPFGAVVVLEGRIIGRGHNTVLADHDPTAHAEMNAIRDACHQLGSHHLSKAVLYTNFEPCPMCLAAVYWADIRELYYCAGREAAERAGFMDRELYDQLSLDPRSRDVKSVPVPLEEMSGLLEEWNNKENKILY